MCSRAKRAAAISVRQQGIVQPARLAEAARHAKTLGLQCHAGHGLSYETITPIAAIAEISEVSIGHFLISTSVFEGLPTAITRMRALINAARA